MTRWRQQCLSERGHHCLKFFDSVMRTSAVCGLGYNLPNRDRPGELGRHGGRLVARRSGPRPSGQPGPLDGAGKVPANSVDPIVFG